MDSKLCKCSAFIGVSLDGFIARESGEIDWLVNPAGESDEAQAEDYGYQVFFDSIDALVMGRKSYEAVLKMKEWLYGDKKVVVLSSRNFVHPAHLRGQVEVMNAEPREVVKRLAARGMRHLYVDGGRTIQGFLRAGLPMELTITRLPVLLGQGIPLFGPLPQDIFLEHLGTKAFPDGLVQSCYKVKTA
jgi:dihydrofolate reductase